MIGVSTYAYFWRISDAINPSMSLTDVMKDAVKQGVELVQICDYPALELLSDLEVNELAAAARNHGLTIELGTRGTSKDHLTKYLKLAEAFGAKLIRSMIQPDLDSSSEERHDRVVAELRSVLPLFEETNVSLALETYEQLPTSELIDVVAAIGSSLIGICLDPANTVANLESPTEVVRACAPYVNNVHVKDYNFYREEGWVGFKYTGAKLGEGLGDYAELMRIVQPQEREINQVIEHWLPWQGDARSTKKMEEAWTSAAVDYLRRMQ